MDTVKEKTNEAPERIWAQIGHRKRSFATREEAIAALMKFTARMNKEARMTKVLVTIICLLSVFTTLPTTATAHISVMPSFCNVPTKPYTLNSEDEVNRYKIQLDKYKDCITLFIDEQKRAIATHREASNAVIAEWNDLIR